MTLVDTGPLVALCDPRDRQHDDFATYRVRRGHRYLGVDIID